MNMSGVNWRCDGDLIASTKMFKFLDKFKRKQLEKAKAQKEEKRAKVKEIKEENSTRRISTRSTSSGLKKDAREMKSDPWKVIYGPLTTEKTTMLGSVNQYAFRVNRVAGKIQVARAIEELYGVNVVGVNTVNIKGKQVNFGRTRGKQSDWKKAIITVAKGEKIDLYAK